MQIETVPRQTRVKRKLLARAVLDEVSRKQQEGVPMAAIVRQLKLDISRPALTNLWSTYSFDFHWVLGGGEDPRCSLDKAEIVRKSLFPEWLDDTNTNIQENPDNWAYVGSFPFGEWVNNDNARDN